MEEEITLGVHGDVNLLKNRFSSGLGHSLPLHVADYDKNDDTYYITLYIGQEYAKCVELLAEYIIERYEPGLLAGILTREHSYLTTAQRREILRSTTRFADDPEVGYTARKQQVMKSLGQYLADNSTMLIDGFVSFRLKEYEEILEDLAERLIDDFLIQKEYDDFLSLLRYFVESQRFRPALVHVIALADGGYRVVDEGDNDITGACLSEIREEGEELHDLTPDDILISILISVAPINVLVHNKQNIKNVELFSTIARVFDGNIAYCNGCSMCMNIPAPSVTGADMK